MVSGVSTPCQWYYHLILTVHVDLVSYLLFMWLQYSCGYSVHLQVVANLHVHDATCMCYAEFRIDKINVCVFTE